MSVDVRVVLIRRAARERPHGELWKHPPTAVIAVRALRLAASCCARDPSLTVMDAVRAAVMECCPGDWSDRQVNAMIDALTGSGW